jgi:mRNA interferase RelE/StbE
LGGGSRVEGARPEYEVVVLPAAARQFRRLQGAVRDRVRAVIDGLQADPRPVGCAKLAGRGDYRVRVGEYRVVYAVDDDQRLVIVGRIAHRRDVYRR